LSQTRAWSWRHAIIKSALPATTRHVLLTISCYMNETGDGCYPTQEQLAEATGLSIRAVRQHLEVAETAGWIKRSEHGFKGQRWRNHEYAAAWPETQDVAKGEEPAAGPSDEGAAPDAGKVRHVVPEGAAPRADYQSSHHSNHHPNARERAGGGFNILWEGWPVRNRPDSREAAESIFSKLAPAEQVRAVDIAKTFLRRCAIRKKPAHLIPYLKQRKFEELYGAPPLDKDGDFVITPDRPEWSLWLGDIRKKFGEPGVASAAKNRTVVVPTRWPESVGA
jgi:hypothetical protein